LARNDSALGPLLAAKSAAARSRALEAILVDHVQPVVRRVLARYRAQNLSAEDAEDLAGTVHLRIVRRLQHLTANDEPIERLNDYIATITYNVVYAYLRRRFPERARLKNRLRYLFTHDDALASWEWRGDIVCGLARWRGREPVQLAVAREDASAPMLDRDAPADAMRAIFERAGGPLLFEDVVRTAMSVWNISDSIASDTAGQPLSFASTPALELETREYIEALWSEVRELREPQRAALLLNLRDVKGTNGLALLLVTGVATFDEIAAVLGMPAERLSEIWNDLPLDDLTIAGLFALSRQQVINLRKSARERLARRMAAMNRRKA